VHHKVPRHFNIDYLAYRALNQLKHAIDLKKIRKMKAQIIVIREFEDVEQIGDLLKELARN
jgi:hypothetical protein